jgi:hypothetical protein
MQNAIESGKYRKELEPGLKASVQEKKDLGYLCRTIMLFRGAVFEREWLKSW